MTSCTYSQSIPKALPSNAKIEKELHAVRKKVENIKQSVEKLEKTVRDSTSAFSALNDNIDSRKNNLQENTKQNILIERRLGKVEKKLGKAKEFEKEINQIHSKIDRNLTHGINITILIITIFTLSTTIFGVFLFGYLRIKLREYKININDNLAITRNINAVALCKKGHFEGAAKEGEKA